MLLAAIIGALLWAASCSKDSTMTSGVSLTNVATERGSHNGRQGVMDVYYDDELFLMNFKELSEQAAKSVIEHNQSLNEIYVYDEPLPDESMFIPVIDAIQGDGFNPLWREVEIEFNDGFTPHQFTSDTEIDAAAEGDNPEITLTETDEVYRCSVIGPHN